MAWGNFPAVIEHQTVPAPQQGWQVIEMQVAGLPRRLVQRQQTGGVPPLQGRLGDELRGQVKIKI